MIIERIFVKGTDRSITKAGELYTISKREKFYAVIGHKKVGSFFLHAGCGVSATEANDLFCFLTVGMGVKDLLKYLLAILVIRLGRIWEFKGKRVAADMSCWIHKGLYSEDYIDYVRRMLTMLDDLNIAVVAVFDGKPPKEKDDEIKRRYEAREKYAAKKPKISDPSDEDLSLKGGSYFERDTEAVENHVITPEIIAKVKEECNKWDNVYIVQSPGEADPQLAFLALNGLVDAVITEDSDLVVYGVENIIFKLNPYGYCQIYERKMLPKWDIPVLRWACILAGCDYLPGGLKGFGLKSGMPKILAVRPSPPYDEKELRRVLRRFLVPEDFVQKFIKADNVFKSGLAHDPRINSVVSLDQKDNIVYGFICKIKTD
jgi:exonuclease-1